MKRPMTFGAVADRLHERLGQGRTLQAADWIGVLKAPLTNRIATAPGRFRAVTFDVKGGELLVDESWELIE